jgi:hypothetical protein
MFATSKHGRFSFRDKSLNLFYLHLYLLVVNIVSVIMYYFNTSHASLGVLVWWIAIVTISYTSATIVPVFHPDDLDYTRFSRQALRVHLGFHMQCLNFAPGLDLRGLSYDIRKHSCGLCDRYSEGFTEGKIKAAEEESSKPSSGIDTGIPAHTGNDLDTVGLT